MSNTIEIQVEDLTKKRVRVIDEKIASLRFEIDSLDQINAMLQADVNVHPFVIQKSVTNTTSKIVTPEGEIKTFNTPSVTSTQVANPKQAIIDGNNNKLKDLRKDENKWSEKKQTVEEDVRRECKASVGFLEELEAMWDIVTTRKLAGVFYLIFFTF